MQASREARNIFPKDQEAMVWLQSQRPDIVVDVNAKLDALFLQNQPTPFQRKEITAFVYFFVACFPKDREFFDVFVEELLKHTDEQELLIYARFLKTCIQEATLIGFDSTRFAYGVREDMKHQMLTQKPLYAVSNMLHLKIYIADVVTQQMPEKFEVSDTIDAVITLLRSVIEILVQTNANTLNDSQKKLHNFLEEAIKLESKLSQIDIVPRLPWIYVLIRKVVTLLDDTVNNKTDIDEEHLDATIEEIQKIARIYSDAMIPLQHQLFGNRPVQIGSGVVTNLPPLHLGSEYTRQHTFNPIQIPDKKMVKNLEGLVQFASNIGRSRQAARVEGLKSLLPAFTPTQMNNGYFTCGFLEEFKTDVEKNEKAFGISLEELQMLLQWEWNQYP